MPIASCIQRKYLPSGIEGVVCVMAVMFPPRHAFVLGGALPVRHIGM
jgi:hypothetical protein